MASAADPDRIHRRSGLVDDVGFPPETLLAVAKPDFVNRQARRFEMSVLVTVD